MKTSNFLDKIPDSIGDEIFEEIVTSGNVTVERIISDGHTSPQTGWYDQEKNEWVMVMQGNAKLQFEDGEEISLSPYDFITIPSHKKHRVIWTDPSVKTIWLAVHY